MALIRPCVVQTAANYCLGPILCIVSVLLRIEDTTLCTTCGLMEGMAHLRLPTLPTHLRSTPPPIHPPLLYVPCVMLQLL